MKRSCYSRKRYEEKEEGKKVQGNPVGYSKNWLVIWGWLLKVFWSFFEQQFISIFVMSLFQYPSGFGTELCKIPCPNWQAFKYVTLAKSDIFKAK